jgi:hypothetical protein
VHAIEHDPDQAARTAERPGALLALAALALIVGTTTAVAGAALRIGLEHSEGLRSALIAWAHGKGLAGSLTVIATCTAATIIAAWLVRRFLAARCRQR